LIEDIIIDSIKTTAKVMLLIVLFLTIYVPWITTVLTSWLMPLVARGFLPVL